MFNNHVLIFERVKEGHDPCRVELNHLFIWVQIYNLPAGYCLEVLRSIGEFVDGYMESDTNKFMGN